MLKKNQASKDDNHFCGFRELTSEGNTWQVKKQWFRSGTGKEIRIYDGGYSTPFEWTCPRCETGRMTIEVTIPLSAFTSFYRQRPPVSLDELISYGGAGHYYRILQCEACGTIYYLSLGYFEPNNGRDVFVIHTILELIRS